MKTNIKVAGTSFHPLPEGARIKIEHEYQEGNLPCAMAKMVLQPEPTNEFDPEAVKVLVPLTDGSAFHLGYIPKAEPLKTRIKDVMAGSLTIKDYGQMGDLNASYVITEIIGL